MIHFLIFPLRKNGVLSPLEILHIPHNFFSYEKRCTETTDETIQQFGKQDFFRHKMQSSGSMYEVKPDNFSEQPLEYNQTRHNC